MSKKTITYLSIIAVVIGSIFLANGLILAWTAPSSAPPDGNVSACYEVFSEDNPWAPVFFYGKPEKEKGYRFELEKL